MVSYDTIRLRILISTASNPLAPQTGELWGGLAAIIQGPDCEVARPWQVWSVWSRGCGMVDSVGPSALPCPCLFFLSCRCQREVSLELLGLESFSNATPSCWHSLPASGKDRGLFCSSRNPNSLSFFQALITKARSLESGDTDHPRSL
jgi:hypothetical protein